MQQGLCFSFFFLVGISSFSQTGENLKYCGSPQMQQILYDQYPQYHSKINNAQAELDQHTLEYIMFKQLMDSDSVLIIPVVFHIIHNYGNENIDDSQIENAIAVLNTDFRNMDTDTSDIRQEFRYLVADCKIEFRLAQLDPYGNCTKGINRIADTLTYVGDHSVKSIIQWPPDKYLNIWVVANAAGLAGHCLNPSSVDTISSWDGVVIQHDYIGAIGTSSEFKSLVLTHEVGHYLNLQHTWGGNNAPNLPYWSPGDTANCGTDDGVDDTPNTIGWQTCNTAGTSCGTLDNVQNYMEYAYCTARMFTQGQKQRMRACLTSSVAKRNNLWSSQNLAATGVEINEVLCAADFNAERTVICEGETVSFTDLSYHGVSSWQWTFSGGNPAVSTDSMPVVTYTIPGKYDVKLTAGNGIQTVDSSKQAYITVLPVSGYQLPYLETFDSLTTILEDEWAVINNDNANGWKLTSQAAYSGTYSVMLENYSNPFEDRADELISNTIDLSGFSNAVLSFRYAYAKKNNTGQEYLKIYASKDCGANWLPRHSINLSSLSNVDSTDLPFYPSSLNQWEYKEITNISSSYLVSDFRAKFVFESGGGNNIFIDDVYINDISMGIKDISQSEKFKIMPNPAEEYLQLSFSSELPDKIELMDIYGNCILSFIPIPEKTLTVPINYLAPGIYSIHMISFSNTYFGRFIKQ